MSKPSTALWNSAKHLLRYLKGTSDYVLYYQKGGNDRIELLGYSDWDWAQEKPTRKYISGYLFFYNQSIISWKSKQQTIVAQSSVEAEIIALSSPIREVLWLKKFHTEFFHFKHPSQSS